MEIFIITFIIFLIIILIMSLGVMLMNKNIKGSCGGLNAISGSNKCSVCNKDIVNLTNKGLATSGDYKNFFTQDGKRYSHIINPKTGKPIMN